MFHFLNKANPYSLKMKTYSLKINNSDIVAIEMCRHNIFVGRCLLSMEVVAYTPNSAISSDAAGPIPDDQLLHFGGFVSEP